MGSCVIHAKSSPAQHDVQLKAAALIVSHCSLPFSLVDPTLKMGWWTTMFVPLLSCCWPYLHWLCFSMSHYLIICSNTYRDNDKYNGWYTEESIPPLKRAHQNSEVEGGTWSKYSKVGVVGFNTELFDSLDTKLKDYAHPFPDYWSIFGLVTGGYSLVRWMIQWRSQTRHCLSKSVQNNTLKMSGVLYRKSSFFCKDQQGRHFISLQQSTQDSGLISCQTLTFQHPETISCAEAYVKHLICLLSRVYNRSLEPCGCFG